MINIIEFLLRMVALGVGEGGGYISISKINQWETPFITFYMHHKAYFAPLLDSQIGLVKTVHR